MQLQTEFCYSTIMCTLQKYVIVPLHLLAGQTYTVEISDSVIVNKINYCICCFLDDRLPQIELQFSITKSGGIANPVIS